MLKHNEHELFMKRCLELAGNGQGNVAPNPMVGSVVVYKGRIIGEGYHEKYGEAHAEVNAIEHVKDKSLLANSTLYVNLEPCAHYGKTPPCSELIVQHNIPRVVIACIDSNVEVAGKGIAYMRKHGVEVITGILEEEAIFLNRRFFTFHEKKRPYVICKWAQSLDGFIDEERMFQEQKGAWLTNESCRVLVHKWRAEEAAILIGKQTALLDNPSLNIRSWDGKDPIRIVIDIEGDLPEHLTVFDQKIPTICYTAKQKEGKRNLEFHQVNVHEPIVKQILHDLHRRDVLSVIVEGGAETIHYFYDENVWDETRLFVGNRILSKGKVGPGVLGDLQSAQMIGDSQIMYFLNR